MFGLQEKMFHCWFNTFFIDDIEDIDRGGFVNGHHGSSEVDGHMTSTWPRMESAEEYPPPPPPPPTHRYVHYSNSDQVVPASHKNSLSSEYPSSSSCNSTAPFSSPSFSSSVVQPPSSPQHSSHHNATSPSYPVNVPPAPLPSHHHNSQHHQHLHQNSLPPHVPPVPANIGSSHQNNTPTPPPPPASPHSHSLSRLSQPLHYFHNQGRTQAGHSATPHALHPTTADNGGGGGGGHNNVRTYRTLTLPKFELDKANKDKSHRFFNEQFSVRILTSCFKLASLLLFSFHFIITFIAF